jgi:type II secretory pathway component GspD/PulD (secretin)
VTRFTRALVGRPLLRVAILAVTTLVVTAGRASAQDPPSVVPESVSIRISETELPAAVQLLGRYLDRPVIFTGNSTTRVTLETPRPVPRTDVVRLLRGLLESHGMELVDDSASGIFRARTRLVVAADVNPATARTQRGSTADLELFVVPLRHARASDVAGTISSLFGRGVAPLPAADERPSTLGNELRQNLIPPQDAPPGARATSGLAGALTGELIVVPDSKANTLLLRANRTDYDLVRALVEQIDIRPLQVLIEVLIAEVRRDRSIGVNTATTIGETPVRGTDLTVAGAIGAQGLGDFVLKIMGIGGTDATSTIALAAQRGDVRILSRPVVLATNNETAEIVVGSQRPFVQVQRSLPTQTTTRDQVVQYKEVGTKLVVRPSISDDGSVHLEVSQEVSNATNETAFDAPVISTRSVQTQLLVRDGQTVALGGLTDQQRDSNNRGVPILSAIPVLGGLFGSQERRTTETELFVFLTPRVIRTDDDAMRVTGPLRARVGEDRPRDP